MHKKGNQGFTSRSMGIADAIEEEGGNDAYSTSSKEIYLQDLLDPNKHTGIEFVQIID